MIPQLTRRQAITSLAALVLPALPARAGINVPLASVVLMQRVGAVLYDMPYLDCQLGAEYRPCDSQRGGEAVANLDEALYLSHHIYG